MDKTNIKTDVALCAECLSCQLQCSIEYAGEFNPTKSRITIRRGEIGFTDDCIAGCHLCANCCAYGALVHVGKGQGELQ